MEVDSRERDVGNAGRKAEAACGVGSDATGNEREELSGNAQLEVVDLCCAEEMSVCDGTIVILIIVIAYAADLLREIPIAGAGSVLFVIPQDVSDGEPIVSREAVVSLGRHLPCIRGASQIQDDVVGVCGILSWAVRRGVKGLELLG